jgi:DNA polymerase-4
VAANKLVAKVATRLVKPDGEYIVAAGEEEPFLAPLPLALIPGIEPEDLLRLREFNLTRAGEVAALRLEELRVRFGSRAMLLYEAVRGIDPSPVLAAGQKPPKVTADHVFGTDTNEAETLRAALYRLVEQAGAELRRRRRAALRVAVLLEYSDGAHCARQAAARPATANDITLFEVAGRALELAWMRRVRVRRLRLVCDRLAFPPAQLALFGDDRQPAEKRDRLISALDAARRRFGADALQFGRTSAAVGATIEVKNEMMRDTGYQTGYSMLDTGCWINTADTQRRGSNRHERAYPAVVGAASSRDDRGQRPLPHFLSSIQHPASRIEYPVSSTPD